MGSRRRRRSWCCHSRHCHGRCYRGVRTITIIIFIIIILHSSCTASLTWFALCIFYFILILCLIVFISRFTCQCVIASFWLARCGQVYVSCVMTFVDFIFLLIICRSCVSTSSHLCFEFIAHITMLRVGLIFVVVAYHITLVIINTTIVINIIIMFLIINII